MLNFLRLSKSKKFFRSALPLIAQHCLIKKKFIAMRFLDHLSIKINLINSISSESLSLCAHEITILSTKIFFISPTTQAPLQRPWIKNAFINCQYFRFQRFFYFILLAFWQPSLQRICVWSNAPRQQSHKSYQVRTQLASCRKTLSTKACDVTWNLRKKNQERHHLTFFCNFSCRKIFIFFFCVSNLEIGHPLMGCHLSHKKSITLVALTPQLRGARFGIWP